mgnify:CR=1 FL=1|jgi:hypothetical protein
MTNLIKKTIRILKNKRRNYLIKKYCKLLNQRTKLARIANKLIGLP